MSATNFPFDNLRQLWTLDNDDTAVTESNYVDATQSFYGQMSYDYAYKYYLTSSIRRDASSIFGGDVKAANFFALGLEHYQHFTEDAISSIPIPFESGFRTIIANAANLRNWGWEGSVQTVNTQGALRWASRFNIARNRNRVTEIVAERLPSSSFFSRGIVEGQDANVIYGIPFAGVDPYNGKALYFMPDGSITDDVDLANKPENWVVIGKGTPTFYGGFTNTLAYKGLSASLLISYSYGSDITVDALTFTDGRQISFNNQSANQLDRWQQPGDLTDTPRLHVSNPVQRNNTRYLFDNDFINFANLNLDWRLPQRWLSAARLRNVSLSVQVDNLGYIYRTTSREAYSFTVNALYADNSLEEFYAGVYAHILRANDLITAIPNLEEGTEGERNSLLGEAYMLRAIGHFDLLRLYAQAYDFTPDASHVGVVILPDGISAGEFPARSSVAESFALVVEDLQRAIQLIGPQAQRSTEPIWLSPLAARALLARVYAYTENWEGVVEQASEVINSGQFVLAGSNEYVEAWQQGALPEVIFELDLQQFVNEDASSGASISSSAIVIGAL